MCNLMQFRTLYIINNIENVIKKINLSWDKIFISYLLFVLQSATSPGASNEGLTKQQLELIQQIMQQTQQQQQQTTAQQQQQQQQQRTTTPSTAVAAQIQKTQKPSIKSTASPGNISNNSGNGNATNNARSSPKPKVWSHSQVSGVSVILWCILLRGPILYKVLLILLV